MARQLRPDHPGTLHHVTNRGQRKADIFLDADDAAFFLELVGKACEKYGVRVLAVCLMRNHFHLVVECLDGNLAKAMQYVEFRYAQRFNYWHGFTGPVFTDRYHSTVVESDEQLQQTIRYVERNPLEVGYEIESHSWTSFGMCLGLRTSPPWLDVDRVIGLFGSRNSYRRYIVEDQPTDKASYADGATPFVPPQRWWRSLDVLASIEEAIVVSIPRDAPDRRRKTEKRDIALLLATDRGIDAADMARRFDMTGGAVRTAVSRMRSRAERDAVTSSWIADAQRILQASVPRS